MITAPQLRAARALLGIDQSTLAQRAGLSLPTIQRMETSGGLIRGNVHSLTKVVQALEDMGVELLGEGSVSAVGGRGQGNDPVGDSWMRRGSCAVRVTFFALATVPPMVSNWVVSL